MFRSVAHALRLNTARRVGLAVIIAAAAFAAPTTALADRDDHRPDRARYEDRRDDRNRNWHDGGGRFDINVRTAPRFEARPIVVAPPQPQVWVAPVYRTVTENVWVEPTYRTVTDRVWREPVVQRTTQRVLVPDRYDWANVPHRDAYGRTYTVREWALVEPEHYVDQPQDVVVAPGHWEDVPRQELVCAGHYEPVTRQELVAAGHWESCAPVAVVPAPRHDRDEARLDVRLRF